MCPTNDSESDDASNPKRGTVLLINRQRLVQADWMQVRFFLCQLQARLAARAFSVCLLSDRAMRRYNQRYRHKDQATDVLSFPAHQPDYLGDILISAETARQNASRYGLRLEDEIKVLILHGVLHLMGYDHETDRGEMARTERLWSTRLGLPSPVTIRARTSLPAAAAEGRR